MASPLLDLPRELRDMISTTIILNNQPLRITTTLTTSRTSTGISQTCRQIRAEYAQLLRRAAFTPGTKTVVPVYNFDFGELIAFVKTMQPHEVVAANRNRNLMVDLFIFDVQALEAGRLGEWVRLCEKVGLEVGYVLQWTTFDVRKGVKGLEAKIGGLREGRKICKVLSARSVKEWSWEGYCREVKCGR